MLKKTLESPLDSTRIKPVNPQGKQPWIFIGRTNVEAEAPVIWALDMKSWLSGKDSDVEKDWKQEEKDVTENEMVWWHHQIDRLEFEQAPGDSEGQGTLVFCSPWGHKELDTTEQQNKSRDQIAKICWIIEKPREFQKNIYFCFIDYAKVVVWITINCGKFWKRWEYQTTWPASWETCMQVKKQHLELDMEQQTGSK